MSFGFAFNHIFFVDLERRRDKMLLNLRRDILPVHLIRNLGRFSFSFLSLTSINEVLLF
jgi:hypothetical protein